MATIWCPRCSTSHSVNAWGNATRDYGEENDIQGEYGSDSGILICPHCGNEIDADEVEIED